MQADKRRDDEWLPPKVIDCFLKFSKAGTYALSSTKNQNWQCSVHNRKTDITYWKHQKT